MSKKKAGVLLQSPPGKLSLGSKKAEGTLDQVNYPKKLQGVITPQAGADPIKSSTQARSPRKVE